MCRYFHNCPSSCTRRLVQYYNMYANRAAILRYTSLHTDTYNLYIHRILPLYVIYPCFFSSPLATVFIYYTYIQYSTQMKMTILALVCLLHTVALVGNYRLLIVKHIRPPTQPPRQSTEYCTVRSIAGGNIVSAGLLHRG